MRTGAGIALPFRSGAGRTCPDRSRRYDRRRKHSWKRPLLLWQTACRRSPRQFRARAAARRTRGLGSPGPLREIPLLQQRFTPSAIQFPQYFLPGRRDRHGLRPGAPLSECVLHAAILRREPFPSRIPPESPNLIQHHFPCRNPSSAIFILQFINNHGVVPACFGRPAIRVRERVRFEVKRGSAGKKRVSAEPSGQTGQRGK